MYLTIHKTQLYVVYYIYCTCRLARGKFGSCVVTDVCSSDPNRLVDAIVPWIGVDVWELIFSENIEFVVIPLAPPPISSSLPTVSGTGPRYVARGMEVAGPIE